MHLALIGDDKALASILAEAAQQGAFVFASGAGASADVYILSNAGAGAAPLPAIHILNEKDDATDSTTAMLRKPFRLSALLETAAACWRATRMEEEVELAPAIVLRPLRKEIEDKKRKLRLTLTGREAVFLARVLAAGDQGLPRHLTLTEIWGYHEESDSHAVDTALYRLRQKLQEIFGKTEMLAARAGAYVWVGKRV